MAKLTEDNSTKLRKRKRASGIDHHQEEVDQLPGKRPRLDQIRILEDRILESRKNLNGLIKLVAICKKSDGHVREAAIVSTSRVLSKLISKGQILGLKKSDTDAVVRKWLRERYADFVDLMCDTIAFGIVAEERLNALAILMHFVKVEGVFNHSQGVASFPKLLFKKIIRSSLDSSKREGDSEFVVDELVAKYIDQYDDLRFYLFATTTEILVEDRDESLFPDTVEWILSSLLKTSKLPANQTDVANFFIPLAEAKKSPLQSLRSHKKQAQEAWMALIKSELSVDQRKRVLRVIADKIAPAFIDVELLMDFLTDSFNYDEPTQLLSLSGIYYLMREKNLDYPSFYAKLYSLLTHRILHSNLRSNFFRSLDLFLSSSHLPAALVASFIKRLSRLALFAPPAGVIVVIPLVYNLFKKHPATTFMMHRESFVSYESGEGEKLKSDDTFDEDEEDPMEAGAIDSCVWELLALQAHYNPNVATFSRIISEQFTKQSYKMESFLDDSYRNMLEVELSKNLKKTPVVEPVIPKRILTSSGDPAVDGDNLILRLWNAT